MSENGYASKDELFSGSLRTRYRDILLPVSGHRVRIKSLTELEFENFQKSITNKRTGTITTTAVRRRMVVACLVDGDGNRLLSDDDLHLLLQWDSADITHINNELTVHLGLSDEDIENMAKNFELTAVDVSHSV